MISPDSILSAPVDAVSDVGSRQQSDAGPNGDSTPAADAKTASDAGDGSRTVEVSVQGEERPERLSLDRVFELLKNSRRRETLKYLRDNEGSASLSDLAEHIAAIENDTTVVGLSSKQRKRVYVGLYQCHLPKMDDMHVVEFEQNRGTIRLAANADQLYPYLKESSERPWHRVYGAISGVGACLFLVSVATGFASTMTLTALLTGVILGVGGFAAVQLAKAPQQTEVVVDPDGDV